MHGVFLGILIGIVLTVAAALLFLMMDWSPSGEEIKRLRN